MRSAKRSHAWKAALICALAVAPGALAHAENSPAPEKTRVQRAGALLTAAFTNASQGNVFGVPLHIDKRAGIQYRRDMTIRNHDVVLAVRGPVVANRGFGLGIELRF